MFENLMAIGGSSRRNVEAWQSMNGRVLIIAGSDPSGGAGIQADIKAVTMLGGYAAAAITALTVQDTTGVRAVRQVPADFIREQIATVLEDIGADAIKIGMIGDASAAIAIAETLMPWADQVPIILDPVLAATSGDALAGDGVKAAILDRLAPLAALITPNLDEASALTGLAINNEQAMIKAGEVLLESGGANAALIKGGHGKDTTITDILVHRAGVARFSHSRIETTSTHGTGCTLASAIATGFAQRMALTEAVDRAINFVCAAIEAAPGFGSGYGPLNHAHLLDLK